MRWKARKCIITPAILWGSSSTRKKWLWIVALSKIQNEALNEEITIERNAFQFVCCSSCSCLLQLLRMLSGVSSLAFVSSIYHMTNIIGYEIKLPDRLLSAMCDARRRYGKVCRTMIRRCVHIIKGGFLYINRRSQLHTHIIHINNIFTENIRAFTFTKGKAKQIRVGMSAAPYAM